VVKWLVHVLFVGQASAEPIVRKSVLDLVANAANQLLSHAIPANWLGKLVNSALIDEDCGFQGCTLNHGAEQLNDRGDRVLGLRLAVASDFELKKGTRKVKATPATRECYAKLQRRFSALCGHVFEDYHDVEDCALTHITATYQSEPALLPSNKTAESAMREEAVRLILEQVVFEPEIAEATDQVFSSDLLNVVDRVLSVSWLPPAITSSHNGGTFNRQAMGRCVSWSSFWGDIEREKQTRSFRGWLLRDPVDHLAVRDALRAKFVNKDSEAADNGAQHCANADAEAKEQEELQDETEDEKQERLQKIEEEQKRLYQQLDTMAALRRRLQAELGK
jgi:hypothetical protein